MKISVVCLTLNILLTVALVHPFRQGGLGVANSATSAVNLALLAYALRRKLGKLDMTDLHKALLPMALAGVGAGLTAWWICRFWERELGHQSLGLKIGAVFAPAALAGLVYWLIATWARVPAAKEMTDIVFKRLFGARKG
jgi:peptidoglycan biosynthesis protein MviN/MurJ (putative lipid II flippase)